MVNLFIYKMILFACALSLSGCIAFPIPTIIEKTPFNAKEIAFIEPGVTTHEEIQEKFGDRRYSGKLFDDTIFRFDKNEYKYVLYSEPRTVGGVLAGSSAHGELSPITTKHYLVVRYDQDDVVRRYDIIRGNHDVAEDGLFVKGDWTLGKTSNFWYDYDDHQKYAILFAPNETDKKAKEFQVFDDACMVYVYAEGGAGIFTSLDIWLNGTAYYVLKVTDPEMEFYRPPYKVECQMGELRFLKVNYQKKLFGKDAATITEIPEEEGKAAIPERRLFLPL